MALPEGLDLEELEVVAQGLDADGEVIDQALEVVRQFITDRGLVLYGGLGLDYALRLRGGRIYPDEERPDYDALSPRNVDDAYDLADILQSKGFPDVQAIPALHVQTMRVRVGFAVVADLSFAPVRVLDTMPVIDFTPPSGGPMRIVHPHWQVMDQHLAFCFPFRDAPREPVFHRFSKDLIRHNLLLEKYPLPKLPKASESDQQFLQPSFSISEEWALHGDAARRLYLAAAAGETLNPLFPKDDLWLACSAFPVEVILTHFSEWGYDLVSEHYPFMDMLPSIFRGKSQTAKAQRPEFITVFHFPARLLAAPPVTRDGDGRPLRVVSAQQLLLTDMLGHHLARKKTTSALSHLTDESSDEEWDRESQACLANYIRLKHAINEGGQKLEQLKPSDGAHVKKWETLVNVSPFSLTTEVLGKLNYGERQLLTIAMDARSTKQKPLADGLWELMPSDETLRGLPRKYTPEINADHPKFSYDISLFRWDGAKARL